MSGRDIHTRNVDEILLEIKKEIEFSKPNDIVHSYVEKIEDGDGRLFFKVHIRKFHVDNVN